MEEAVQFSCRGKRLYGILHVPDPQAAADTVVIMVVGGPQTRVGSHRLYVQLARFLCSQGVAVLRFDYEGLGDSDGDFVGYEQAGPSIGAAVGYAGRRFPKQARIIIWSLCNGATTVAIWAGEHRQEIEGLILCNPYVLNNQESMNSAMLKHYYVKRLFSREFWNKLLSLRIGFGRTFSSFFYHLKDSSYLPRMRWLFGQDHQKLSIEDLVFDGLVNFGESIFIVLSSNDVVANHFYDCIKSRKDMKELLHSKSLAIALIEGADHTFTTAERKQELFKTTITIIRDMQQKEACVEHHRSRNIINWCIKSI